ncbi:septum site-determining protein MinC [Moraxella osloensis]|uniref:Probable septum site-determining protein MinC n=1 Tax=Faucicola osloensis TaxID=34062 RepID=A0A378Q7W4_FAUOS|nr:septum site-determining protein MinC [Moraxella osloensis]AME01360.1 septum site-determining protein MinC [Moraxella osloensis]QPT42906.1 septum site-determining protein MinC [Moraxella osloensis]STY96504.1 Septum site-determining protein MinC [Moraxella osloensis]
MTQPAALDLTQDSSSQNLQSVPNLSEQDSAQSQQPANPLPTDPVATSVKLTGRLLNFTRLNIEGNDIKVILTKIAQKLGRQRQSNLPVIVSCQQPLNLAQLWGGLWVLGLQPIGLVTGANDTQANELRIAIFPADGQRIDGKAAKNVATGSERKSDSTANTPSSQHIAQSPTQSLTSDSQATKRPTHAATLHQTANDIVTNDTASNATTSNNTVAAPDKFVASPHHQSQLEGDLVHSQMLRSGQSINHVGGDVILTKGINAGAEAITDYSLHVYGKAEGRLVAGATGDTNAKIFCLRFNPSLVSVAGTYCLKENIPTEYLDKAVQVSYLDGQGLVFELME